MAVLPAALCAVHSINLAQALQLRTPCLNSLESACCDETVCVSASLQLTRQGQGGRTRANHNSRNDVPSPASHQRPKGKPSVSDFLRFPNTTYTSNGEGLGNCSGMPPLLCCKTRSSCKYAGQHCLSTSMCAHMYKLHGLCWTACCFFFSKLPAHNSLRATPEKPTNLNVPRDGPQQPSVQTMMEREIIWPHPRCLEATLSCSKLQLLFAQL